MKIEVLSDKKLIGEAAAEVGAKALREALAAKPEVAIIVATGVSQFEMLDSLIKKEGIDWSRVTIFHLDEYIGLPATHPACFRKFLRDRLVTHLPTLKKFIDINGDEPDLTAELARLNKLISGVEVDLCFVGIGENGHIAFNVPPADFDTRDPYLIVDLDEACRRQQLGEGWFPTLEEVPQKAISMSIREIMRARKIILLAADTRKTEAIKNCFGDAKVSNLYPASILKEHPDFYIFMDKKAAAGL